MGAQVSPVARKPRDAGIAMHAADEIGKIGKIYSMLFYSLINSFSM